MKQLLTLTAVALACTQAIAQFSGAPVTSAPVSLSPISAMPAGKIYVKPSTVIKPRAGKKTEKFGVVCTGTYAACIAQGGGQLIPSSVSIDMNKGAFRVDCKTSHMAFDDPIVVPGRAGVTHLHVFFGNTKTRSATDLINMATSGDSTCFGGTLNRSGYWVPPFIYHCPEGSTDGCNLARNGEVIPPQGSNFYYKCDYDLDCQTGGFNNTPIQWWPAGFRMIAGNPTGTTVPGAGVKFLCNNSSSSLEIWYGKHIPTATDVATFDPAKGPCTDLQVNISFPICIAVGQLDSPDHKSHTNMVVTPYLSNFSTGCRNEPNYPIMTPEIGFNIHTVVNQADLPYIRLSSDPPKSSGQVAGWTMHADWVNGWSTTPKAVWGNRNIGDVIMKECHALNDLPKQKKDCHNHLLGDPTDTGVWWSVLE